MLGVGLSLGGAGGAILTLAGSLLQQIIRHQKACLAARAGDAETVGRIEIVFQGGGGGGVGAVIAEVRSDGRVEIVIGEKPFAGDGSGGRSRDPLRGGVRRAGVEAAALQDEGAVKTGVGIAHGVDFDHAAELLPEFGRYASRVDFETLHVVGVCGGGEGGRAVVVDGKAVDNVLGVVLGFTRVENAIGFERPAGLHDHEVRETAPGERRGALLQFLCTDVVRRVGSGGIDQGIGLGNEDGGLDGSEIERDGVLKRNRGAERE